MRISDWSSDVCSSDLARRQVGVQRLDVAQRGLARRRIANVAGGRITRELAHDVVAVEIARDMAHRAMGVEILADRKRVVSGKRVSVSVDLGGSRSLKKNKDE